MTDLNKTYVFSDDLVATMAKLIQVAILTGTDIYDHLRTIQCVTRENELCTSPDYAEKIEEEIASMLKRAQSLASEK
jgi:hypothetical protein